MVRDKKLDKSIYNSKNQTNRKNMGILSKILDSSILFSFDRSGFIRHAKKFTPEKWSGEGKVAVITGANAGIGFSSAELLVKNKVETHLLCRSRERGIEATKKLEAKYPNSTIHLHILDISDKEAINIWVKEKAPSHIDILINNAGGMSPTLNYTGAGDEVTWATHLLGHYFLTSGLIKRGQLNKGSRVITVTSGGMYLQKLNLSDLLWKNHKYDKYRSYANAKRAQVILTQLWDEKFGADIRFSSMHPGWVNTKGVSSAMPVFYGILRWRLRTPEQGADTILWLALTNEEYSGGKLWFDRSIAPQHKFQFTKESEIDRNLLWNLLGERNEHS